MQIPARLIQRGLLRRTSPKAVMLLWALASLSGDDGECKLPRRVLSDLTGLGRCAVDRAKRQLNELGLLFWKKGTKGSANHYYLRLGPVPGKPYRVLPTLNL